MLEILFKRGLKNLKKSLNHYKFNNNCPFPVKKTVFLIGGPEAADICLQIIYHHQTENLYIPFLNFVNFMSSAFLDSMRSMLLSILMRKG